MDDIRYFVSTALARERRGVIAIAAERQKENI